MTEGKTYAWPVSANMALHRVEMRKINSEIGYNFNAEGSKLHSLEPTV